MNEQFFKVTQLDKRENSEKELIKLPKVKETYKDFLKQKITKDISVSVAQKEIIIELWRKKWIIAASAIFCALVACLIWGRSNSIPMYESSGSMMILNQKEEAADSTQLSISTRLTDDYASVMLSRNTVNRVISNLK